jgi:hypothetical protein
MKVITPDIRKDMNRDMKKVKIKNSYFCGIMNPPDGGEWAGNDSCI